MNTNHVSLLFHLAVKRRRRGRCLAASAALLPLVVAAFLCAPATSVAQTFAAEWSTPDIGRLGPTGLALDTTGGVTYLYASDQNHGRIIKFNAATGARVAAWGETGNGDGQFNSPFGLAVDPATHDIYVVERGNSRIQRITSN